MTSRQAVLAVVTLLWLPVSAGAQQLSAKELKKVMRQADKAYAAGEGEQAVELYGQVLASTPAGDSRRGNALYAVAMARLSPEGPAPDVATGRQLLEELAASFPRHPRQFEISATRALLAELEATRAELGRHDAELAAKLAELEAQRQQMEAQLEAQRQAIAGKSEAAGGKVKSLEAQLRKMRAELAETQAELTKKEESLQKLRDALVNRGG